MSTRVTSPNLRGLTIVELLAVVAIIGVLAALIMPRFHAYKVRARRGEAKVNLGQIKSLQSIYQVEHYRFKTLPLAGYKGTCDTSDGTPLAALGFAPDDCAQMRYGYKVGTSSSKAFTATAFGPSDADGRWIYPCCNGAGASECGESSGDKVRVTNKKHPEVCRDITKYCDAMSCVGGGSPGGTPPTTCAITSCPSGETFDAVACTCNPATCSITSCPSGETFDAVACTCNPATCSITSCPSGETFDAVACTCNPATCSITSCPSGETFDAVACTCNPATCSITSCPSGETFDAVACTCNPATCSNMCVFDSYEYGTWSSWSPALTCPGPDVTQTRTRTVTEKFDMPTNACATLTSCPDQTNTETQTGTNSCPTAPCRNTCEFNSYSYGSWSSWSPTTPKCPSPDVTQTRSRTVTEKFDKPIKACPSLLCPDQPQTPETETRNQSCVSCNQCTENTHSPTYTPWLKSNIAINPNQVCDTDTYEEWRDKIEKTTYTAAASNSCVCPANSTSTKKETRDLFGKKACCAAATHCCNSAKTAVLKSSKQCDAAYNLDPSNCSCNPPPCSNMCVFDSYEYGKWSSWSPTPPKCPSPDVTQIRTRSVIKKFKKPKNACAKSTCSNKYQAPEIQQRTKTCTPKSCSMACVLDAAYQKRTWVKKAPIINPANVCIGTTQQQTGEETIATSYKMPINPCTTLTSCPADNVKTSDRSKPVAGTKNCKTTTTCANACAPDTANKTEAWSKEAPIIDATTVCIGETEQQKEKGIITTPYKMPANACSTLTSCPADKVENKDRSKPVAGTKNCNCCDADGNIVKDNGSNCASSYTYDPIAGCKSTTPACKNTCDDGCTEWVEGDWSDNWSPHFKMSPSQILCRPSNLKQSKAQQNKRSCSNLCDGVSCTRIEVKHKYRYVIGNILCGVKTAPPNSRGSHCLRHNWISDTSFSDPGGWAQPHDFSTADTSVQYTGDNCSSAPSPASKYKCGCNRENPNGYYGWDNRPGDPYSYYDKNKGGYYRVEMRTLCFLHTWSDGSTCTTGGIDYRVSSGTQEKATVNGLPTFCSNPKYSCVLQTDL